MLTRITALVLVGSVALLAKDRPWQQGHWRDSELQTVSGGTLSIPIGGTPPSTVAGVTIAGTAPTYLSIPTTGTVQVVQIDGDDGMTYIAVRPVSRPWPVIVNDPITFAIENDRLYTKGNGADPMKEFWFTIVKRIRRTDR